MVKPEKKTAREVTLFFKTAKQAETFAVEASLCMAGSEEFDPVKYLNTTAKFTAIRLGDKECPKV